MNIDLGWATAVEPILKRLLIGQDVKVAAFRTDKMSEGQYVAVERILGAGPSGNRFGDLALWRQPAGELKYRTLRGAIMTNHIFGPVPSRRLGRSLGVDLVPLKTCTYDCIYCQLGRTTRKTIETKEWVALENVLDELQKRLSSEPDYITLSGSGEPTLFSRVDELIDRIKAMTDVRVAVLTNGSLLCQKDVRRQLMNADLVIPSLDAGDEAMFRLVNRPHEQICFEQMLNGLIEFRRDFRGEYWLEVFVVGAYTAIPGELTKVAKCVDRIRPDRVQLNTVTRPPAEKYAVGVPSERLAKLTSIFHPRAEIIADFRGVHRQAEFVVGREEILQMLRRRPCSVDDIAGGLGMHRSEVIKYVEELNAESLLEESPTADKLYYKVTKQTSI